MATENFTCPDCGAKITRRDHFDEDEGWFECEECEGIFMEEELAPVKKEGRRTEIVEERPTKKVKPQAKNKKAKPEKPAVKKKSRSTIGGTHARDAVPTGQILNIMADEILEIYKEFNRPLDLINAREKALILNRGMVIGAKATFHDKPVKYVLCKEHE